MVRLVFEGLHKDFGFANEFQAVSISSTEHGNVQRNLSDYLSVLEGNTA